MPSGKTHDKISWYFFVPAVWPVWQISGNTTIVFLFALSYLFSSFMFGGDLDLKSVQTKRWGLFRWIWIPYQTAIPHRSVFSHGILWGTIFRVLYLSICLIIFYLSLFFLTHKLFPDFNQEIINSTNKGIRFLSEQQIAHLLAIFAGLVTGAGLHTLSDVLVSKFKRIFLRKKKKKNKK